MDPGQAARSVTDADGLEQAPQSLDDAGAGVGLPRAVQVCQQRRVVRARDAPSGFEIAIDFTGSAGAERREPRLVKFRLRSPASLLPDPAAGTLTVRLLHQASRAHDAALAPLLAELNATRTVFPGTQLRLVYELPSSDGSQPTAS